MKSTNRWPLKTFYCDARYFIICLSISRYSHKCVTFSLTIRFPVAREWTPVAFRLLSRKAHSFKQLRRTSQFSCLASKDKRGKKTEQIRQPEVPELLGLLSSLFLSLSPSLPLSSFSLSLSFSSSKKLRRLRDVLKVWGRRWDCV